MPSRVVHAHRNGVAPPSRRGSISRGYRSNRLAVLPASLAVSLCAAVVAAIALAGPADDVDAAYERGDYTKVLQLLRPQANEGSAWAQNNLAHLYESGLGVPQDFTEAVKWYRKAADQGYGPAQTSLGNLYFWGQGIQKDHVEAMKWYGKAADAGDVVGAFRLGMMYYGGLGGPQDYAEAMRWIRRAADRGYASAQLKLGTVYSSGQGVPQDYVEAYKWYSIAASQFPKPDAAIRYLATESRDVVSPKMTPEQIAEGERLAREWRPTK